MSVSDEIRRIQNAKANIKTSIENKGVTVPDDAKLDAFPALIDSIEAGGGSGETHTNPDFYELRTNGGTNFDYLFYYYNGSNIDASSWDTSKVTSAQYCFSYCRKSIDISNWDLSNLTNASYMFNNFNNGNKYLDLSLLDFSNVKDIDRMFYYSNTNYLDVRNINLIGATNYEYLFYYCDGTELDLSSWDISKVKSLSRMCYYSYHKKINLTGWNTINVTDMSYTFYSSYLESLLIPDWDMTNAASTSSFLYDSSSSKLKHIDLSRSNDFTINKIASFLPTRTVTTYGEIIIPANTSQDAIDAVIAKYWKPVGPKFDLISTELALDNDTVAMGKTINISTVNNPWYGDDRLETIEFISSDESVATINGRVITGVSEGTVEITCRRRDTQEIISVAPFTLTVADPSFIDKNYNYFVFDTTKASGTTIKLQSYKYGDTTDWDGLTDWGDGTIDASTSHTYSSNGIYKVKTKCSFNSENGALGALLADSNTRNMLIEVLNVNRNIKYTQYMFNGCYNVTSIDASSINTSIMKDMTSMFDSCSKLETLNLSNWNMDNITNTSNMFASCSKLHIANVKMDNCNESTVSKLTQLIPA